MDSLVKLANVMASAFKELPSLPKNWQQTLANIWPWLALIAGILQVLGAFLLWGLTRTAINLVDGVNTYSSTYYTVGLSGVDKFFIYIGILVLLVEGILFLMAFSPLRLKQSKGWYLVFLAGLLNLLYAIVTLFISARGFGGFLGSLVGSFAGFYLLFQIRGYFIGSKKTSSSTKETK